ncbi:hypothetical protein IFM89_013232 [Coptis chinensis]|uniref:Nucleolar complex protein 2 homolog n=1 Tax=Coptis chinensis TaxID=261450 RepID=A0A835IQQ1_9MAGN|nr:hypothetical protein IFM89_013232 [Coptis chinensis]
MGKLGKKARKFAKKNLQSVHKRNRKMNSMIKKKHPTSRNKGDAAKEPAKDATVQSSGRDTPDIVVGDYSLDPIFSGDESDSTENISDSDGFLSEPEDSNCAYTNENESDNNSENGGSALSGQNKEINQELSKQKRKLDRLKEKDPEFSKFVERQNIEQLTRDEAHSDGEDDTSDGEVDTSDQDMVDSNKGGSIFLKNNVLSNSVIESWSEQVMAQQNFSVLPNLLNAYRAACHYGSEDGFDANSCQRVKHSGALCKITMFMLQESDGIFRRMLGIGSSSCKIESILGLKNTEKWKTVKPLIKSYLRSTLFLLDQVTDSEILVFSLTQLRASIVLFAAFPSLLRRLIKASGACLNNIKLTYWVPNKVAVHLWATGGGAVSSSAFLLVRTISLVVSKCRDTCLVKAYKAFLAHCKIVESGNLKHLQFLVDSLVELYSLDVPNSFIKAQVSIQQLAMILLRGVKTKKKEILKKIYNWQYTNCIDLWVRFISANIRDHDLQALLYLIIQVINGVAHLFPGPRYLPLRLKCIQMLNRLSSSSGVFIPITSFVLDSLEYIGNSKPDATLGKDFDVSSVLKVPKQWLKLKYFQEELLLSVIELLSIHFSQWSFHISFPEVATIPLIRLRQFQEKVTAESLRRPVKRFIDQVQQNIEFVEKKRDEAAFSPKDLESVESFVQLKACGGNSPFVQYYESVVRKSLNQGALKKTRQASQRILNLPSFISPKTQKDPFFIS